MIDFGRCVSILHHNPDSWLLDLTGSNPLQKKKKRRYCVCFAFVFHFLINALLLPASDFKNVDSNQSLNQ